MTRTDDLLELKRMAEAWLGCESMDGDYWRIGREYQTATTPDRILSLIARVEAAEARVKELEATKPQSQS